MFKLSAAITTFAISAQASEIQAENPSAEELFAYNAHNQEAKPDFSIGSHYQQPDYTTPYQAREQLPSADFNRRVYEFDNNDTIWDQNDYEERVKVEAELMVALESMKEGVSYGSIDVNNLNEQIADQKKRIDDNAYDIFESMKVLGENLQSASVRVSEVQAKCQYTHHDIHDAKDVLILYCQQFAYSPEIVPACAQILTCKSCHLHPRFQFGHQHAEHQQQVELY